MVDRNAPSYFLRPADGPAPARVGLIAVEAGERVLWQGRAGVAEQLHDEATERSAVRWTLPSSTEVVVTDRRLAYAHAAEPAFPPPPRFWPPYQALDRQPAPGRHRAGLDGVSAGEVRWQWPYHLRVCPGTPPRPGPAGVRAAQPTQVQLVCRASPTDGRPTLALFGGDLATVGDADRLANLLRRAVVQFRLDNAGPLGLSSDRLRALARRLIAPEFANYQGGPSQSVGLPGAVPVGFPRERRHRQPTALAVAAH